MRLKAEVEKEISAIYKAKYLAKKENDKELEAIYTGMFQALMWVSESRNSTYYTLVDTASSVNIRQAPYIP